MSNLRSKYIMLSWSEFQPAITYNESTMQQQFVILKLFCEYYNRNVLHDLCEHNQLHTMELQRLIEG